MFYELRIEIFDRKKLKFLNDRLLTLILISFCVEILKLTMHKN